jgi:hypothetical protein
MSETQVPPEFKVEGAREMSREIAERCCEEADGTTGTSEFEFSTRTGSRKKSIASAILSGAYILLTGRK